MVESALVNQNKAMGITIGVVGMFKRTAQNAVRNSQSSNPMRIFSDAVRNALLNISVELNRTTSNTLAMNAMHR